MKLFILFLSLFLLCGCEAKETADIFAMDTIISLEIYGKNSEDALSEMKSEISRLDQKFSPDATNAEDPETSFIIKKAEDISMLADKSFNIYLGEVMKVWGFRDKNYHVPSPDELSVALNTKTLDFGGIAKGYAGDCLSSIAAKHGIKSGILSLGGNVVAIGKRPDGKNWKVGITDPTSPSDYIGYTEVFDKSVVTSGSYQRYFEDDGKIYHHIIDPKNGMPADNGVLSVTVISPDGTLADALSTAFFVLGADRTLEIYHSRVLDFEAVIIKSNGEIITTDSANFIKTD